MSPIGVVGLGNLGTAIAYLIAQNGYQVLGWDRSSGLVDEINNLSQNNRYLPEIILPVNLQATNSLAQLFDSCQISFIA